MAPDSVVGVDHGVGGWISRVDVDRVTGVGVVRRGHLEPLAAFGAGDEEGFSMFEMMKALEGVDSPQRDPLPGTAAVAGVGDPGEEPAYESGHGGRGRAGWRAFTG